MTIAASVRTAVSSIKTLLDTGGLMQNLVLKRRVSGVMGARRADGTFPTTDVPFKGVVEANIDTIKLPSANEKAGSNTKVSVLDDIVFKVGEDILFPDGKLREILTISSPEDSVGTRFASFLEVAPKVGG